MYKKKTNAALLSTKEQVKHASEKVVEAFKASADFRSKITERAMFTYHIDFKKYLKKVKESLSDANLSRIFPNMLETSDGSEEENEAIPTKAATLIEVATTEAATATNIEASVSTDV
ncbi:putative methyltransferase PMT21 [Cocos nucifera]|nr:putative methyltransferase PMT21 [Cocos nucifera]